MFPENSQFDMNDEGEVKRLSEEGVEDVTPKNLFANFTVYHRDTGNVLMRGSQINTPGGRAHIESESGKDGHKVVWHDEEK
jgi:hypothetical protein